MKRFIIMVLALACLLSAMPVTQAQAASFRYDAEAAAAYALANWDNGDGTVCDQYVKKCLMVGGVEINAGDVTPVMNALVDAGFGTKSTLKLADDGVHINKADNPALKIGDPVIFHCDRCDEGGVHIVMITGFDDAGNALCSGHNPEWINVDWFGSYKHYTDDRSEYHDQVCTFYAVHMDTSEKDHQHSYKVNQFEDEHPHKMYDQCTICSAKYYLGWNARMSACTICNPPVDTKPIVTASIVQQDGKDIVSLSWTTVADTYGYYIHRATTESGTYYQLNDTAHTTTSFANSAVEPGGTYYFKVEAVKNNGDSAFSDVVKVKIPGTLAAPVLTHEPNTSTTKPSMRWTAIAGAAEYEVYRALHGTGNFELLYTSTAVTYVNSGAADYTSYDYKVRAVMEDGTYGEFSNVLAFIVEANLVPTLTKKEASSGKPSMTWTSVTGAVKYEVKRSIAGANNYDFSYTTKYTSYTNTGAAEGVSYDYKVRAVMADGSKGEFSNVLSFIEDTPAIPVMSKKTTTGKPSMKWTAVAGAVKYEVKRTIAGANNYNFTYTTKYTSYTNSGAVDGTSYEYKVRAIMADGSYGQFSAPLAFMAETTSVPVMSKKTTTGKPSMKWTAVAGAVKYEVKRTIAGANNYNFTYTTKYTSYTNSGAADGTSYEYKVRAIMADGSYGEFSAPLAFMAETTSVPVMSKKTTTGKPSMKWTAVAGAVKYEVKRSVAGANSYNFTYTTKYTSYTNSNAVDGTSYEYKVRAIMADGSYGEFSAPLAFMAETTTVPVMSKKTTTGKPSMKWTAVAGAVKYEVKRANSGSDNFSFTYSTTYTSYTNTGASKGKTYDYKVRAIMADGSYSEFSNVLTFSVS